MTTMTLEMQTLKSRLKATWMSGDYGHFAKYLEAGAIEFLARLPITRDTRMLDVACGAGQIAIPAARFGAHVTGVDIASNLINQARARAKGRGLDVRFDEGDAESLPYEDASFDLVVSLIGAMFAPVPERVAAELVRVCRPGGRIGLAAWTPTGFLGQLFRVVATYVPPTPGVRSPLLWGTDAHIQDLFAGAARIEHTARHFAFRYRSPEHWVEVFRTYYGPVHKAFAALDAEKRAALDADLLALLRQSNRVGASGLVVPAEYLETVITR